MTDEDNGDGSSGDLSKVTQFGPWQRKRRELRYANPWIQVQHDEVTTPGGTDGIYGVVQFANRAVGIVAIDDQQHTWLVQQYRYTLQQTSWEIPEGGCAANEALLDAAQRELAEEVGLHAASWQPLLDLHLSNSVTDESGRVFLAQQLSTTTAALEATEADLIVRRLPFCEAVDMAMRGEITDAMSVAGLLAAERLLNS